MKNININGVFCDIIPTPNTPSVSLGNINKRLHIINDGNLRKISQLSMVVFVSATQTKDIELLGNIDPKIDFSFNEKYEVRVRLTETFSGVFQNLGDFILDPKNNYVSHGICKSTFNHVQFFLLPEVPLPSQSDPEKFVIKLLIRKKEDDRTQDDGWIIQSICPIDFDN